MFQSGSVISSTNIPLDFSNALCHSYIFFCIGAKQMEAKNSSLHEDMNISAEVLSSGFD